MVVVGRWSITDSQCKDVHLRWFDFVLELATTLVSLRYTPSSRLEFRASEALTNQGAEVKTSFIRTRYMILRYPLFLLANLVLDVGKRRFVGSFV